MNYIHVPNYFGDSWPTGTVVSISEDGKYGPVRLDNGKEVIWRLNFRPPGFWEK